MSGAGSIIMGLRHGAGYRFDRRQLSFIASASTLSVDDSVLLPSKPGDAHLDDVAWLEVAWRLHAVRDARRCPGRDDVACA